MDAEITLTFRVRPEVRSWLASIGEAGAGEAIARVVDAAAHAFLGMRTEAGAPASVSGASADAQDAHAHADADAPQATTASGEEAPASWSSSVDVHHMADDDNGVRPPGSIGTNAEPSTSSRRLPVPGYAGMYEVSEDGIVYSVKNGHAMIPAYSTGRPVVNLTRDGAKKARFVGRIVCEAFHGPAPSAQHVVMHAEGSARSPRASAVSWATRAEVRSGVIQKPKVSAISEEDARTRHGCRADWRPIPGHSAYSISSDGWVLSQLKTCSLGYLNHEGYRKTMINYRTFSVHRLVCLAFHGPPVNQEARFVNHMNGNKSDNRAENLEWVTPSENSLHAYRTGLVPVRARPPSLPAEPGVQRVPVVGYEGVYEVSDDGRVFSVKTGRVLSTRPTCNGAPQVALLRNGKNKTVLVARLVCEAFRGLPPSPEHMVLRVDGNPENVRLDNLKWGTKADVAYRKRKAAACVDGSGADGPLQTA
jgi:hypothetical protein